MPKMYLIFAWSFVMGISLAQQNTLPLNSYYKDRLFSPQQGTQYRKSAFLPVNEGDYNLHEKIRDSSIQYYTLTDIIFKKHLLEFKGDNYYLTLSPILDLSRGRDFQDSNDRQLFQNTRGFFIEADLTDKFSFMTSFYENQSRNSRYESDYYTTIGERYPSAKDSLYHQQNAVIPGGARTKVFKNDGFDYAYAIGNIVYRPLSSLTLSAGNNHQFIGEGYRSLLLSDNSCPSPYLRTDLKLGPFLYTYYRSRGLNLLRRPISTTVESYYESKGISVNYLTYQPVDVLQIAVFEAGIWSRGDSLHSKNVHPLFYNPVPGFAGFILDDQELLNLIGVNIGYQVTLNNRVYGQLILNGKKPDNPGIQFGWRNYNLLNISGLLLHLEYNHLPSGIYSSPNPRLNYSSYNLPLGHVKGDGFDEFVFRASYNYKRAYAEVKSNYYALTKHIPNSLLAVYQKELEQKGSIFNQQLEIGYRFNKRMNLSIFINLLYRHATEQQDVDATLINLGLRTGITNRYTDF